MRNCHMRNSPSTENIGTYLPPKDPEILLETCETTSYHRFASDAANLGRLRRKPTSELMQGLYGSMGLLFFHKFPGPTLWPAP